MNQERAVRCRIEKCDKIRCLKARQPTAEAIANNTVQINRRVDGKSSHRLLRLKI
ncbi:hypothetical protein [Microcoleus sp. herbarium7]|uniref:hypothetical protein n=1 Tax=Microcoleus sp. herbarium7 TaxID=3055435 RepID=UPI002FD7232A